MEPLDHTLQRHRIIHDYARWCAFSSTRSGSPLKSRKDIYPLIDLPKYGEILTGPLEINKEEFNLWHEVNALSIQSKRPEMCIGWAAKLINVYLKTMVYVGSIGRPGLSGLIHPPIDGGLWDGIKANYKSQPEIITKTHIVTKIKDIQTYAQYQTIISGLMLIAEKENHPLFEVEHLWQGTEF